MPFRKTSHGELPGHAHSLGGEAPRAVRGNAPAVEEGAAGVQTPSEDPLECLAAYLDDVIYPARRDALLARLGDKPVPVTDYQTVPARAIISRIPPGEVLDNPDEARKAARGALASFLMGPERGDPRHERLP